MGGSLKTTEGHTAVKQACHHLKYTSSGLWEVSGEPGFGEGEQSRYPALANVEAL